MSDQIVELVEKQGRAFEEFKTVNDKKLAEIEANGKATGETLIKLEAIGTDMNGLKDQLADIQAKQSVPMRDRLNGKSDVEIAHVKSFENFIRNPKNPSAMADLEARASEFHQKAVTITGTGGGNAIPTEIHAAILAKISDLSPMRQYCNVSNVSNENTKFVVSDNDSAGGWVGAGGSRSATATPSVQAVALTYGTVYAYPSIQEEALNDISYDVMSWLVNDVSRRIAVNEGIAFVSGNGSDKPTGLVAGSPVSTGDEASPARAFGTLQYIASGVAASFPLDRLGSPAGDPAGPLFDLVYGVKAGYRANATWMMNRATLSTIMQFRNADGDYLFRPSSTAGVPGTLMGYPVVEAEAFADIGANAFPIAFGDFREGYQVGDIVNTMRITMDDNITAPGFVKFYARKRVGGKVLNDDAIKLLKIAAS